MNTYFGGFFRRPLENALSRVVECWQLSQPPHLRHLAIVRDTAVRRTITHYIHYSARNFRRLVDAGQTSWEAVEFVPKDSKAANVVVPPVDVVPELDEYGLPPAIPANQLLKKGDATLLECLLVAKPADYLISSSDPVAVRLDDGRYGKWFLITKQSLYLHYSNIAFLSSCSGLTSETSQWNSTSAWTFYTHTEAAKAGELSGRCLQRGGR